LNVGGENRYNGTTDSPLIPSLASLSFPGG